MQDKQSLVASYIEKTKSRVSDALAIARAKSHYGKFLDGEDGIVPRSEIQTPDMDSFFPYEQSQSEQVIEKGKKALRHSAIIKLNGGLGTSMGCEGPKSLVEIEKGRRFLDSICLQVDQLRADSGHDIPLVFMNSFFTEDATRKALGHSRQFESFLQNEIPKIDLKTNLPFDYPEDRNQEWNPPGHGDIYLSLETSGMLEKLLNKGVRWAFISNSDNVGASFDPGLLGLMAEKHFPFMMEVTPKTLADKKGGTLIFRNGKLCLLERAQVEPTFIPEFEDIKRFTVFNTNNLWVDLEAVGEYLDELIFNLQLIVNRKRVGQHDVAQLETAMGSAIGCFPHSAAVVVPRHRFIPVKSTSDLMILRSDAVQKGDQGLYSYHPNIIRNGVPKINLDDAFKRLEDFEKFVKVIPSLKEANSLTVKGPYVFDKPLVVKGDLSLTA